MANYNFLPPAPGVGTRFKANPTTGDLTSQTPTFDALSKKWVSSVTGQPWTGPLGTTGNFAKDGAFTSQNPNPPPNQEVPGYQAVQVTKSPALAAGTQDLMKSFKEGADLIDFGKLLDEARAAQGNVKTAYQNQTAALDPTAFANTMRGLDTKAAAQTGAYADTARSLARDYTGADTALASNLGDITKRAYDILPQYDQAASAIGDNQIQQMLGEVAKNKIASGGGDLGVSTNELRQIARGVANVELPLAQQKIQRQYDVLTGVERPAAQEIASRAENRIAQFQTPLEQNIYSRTYNDVMQQKQTEVQIQQLKQVTAGMNVQAAESYLRSLALPQELIAQVLGRQASTLGQIGNLENEAYYRGLQYTPGAQLSQPVGFSSANPPFQVPNRYGAPTVQPQGNTATGNTTATADPNAEVNRLRALNAAQADYLAQTGQNPATDPYLSEYAWNNAVDRYSGKK